MDGQHRSRLDGVQHPLGLVGRGVAQVQVHPQARGVLRPRRQFVQGLLVNNHMPLLLVLIHVHRVLVVVGSVEVDDDTKRRATLTSSPPRLLSLIPYQHFQ